jgi:plastocyanin
MAALPLAPAEAGGGCHSEGVSSQPTAGTEVRMERVCFTPAVLQVDPGTTVRFTNQDEVVHVVVGTGWGTGDQIPTGGTFEHRFAQTGTFPYSCYLHPGMNGAIVVGDASAAAPARTELASATTPTGVDSTAAAVTASTSDAPDDRLLAIGALASAALGALAATGWTRRRNRSSRQLS